MPIADYHDTDTGFIHYVSDILPKLECRVFDAVRAFEDIEFCRKHENQRRGTNYVDVS